MKKFQLFFNFNRSQKMKYFMLFLVFSLTGAIISATLLVSQNSIEYYQPEIKLLSSYMLIVILKECLILCTIAFWGSLISATYVYNKNIMNILNQRMNPVKNQLLHRLSAVGIIMLLIEVFLFFHASVKYIFIMLSIATIMMLLLYILFHFVFSKKC